MDFFHQIAFVVGVTILLALLAKFFKQPLIISYIVSGIIVGPYFLNIVNNFQVLDTFSQMGIALLLFIVGLGLSPEIIKDVGKVSLISGVGQVLFTSVIGFLIALGFGFDWLSSIYIAIALTFSSTIIIMKLLSDRGDTDALYGKIAIGFLIVQDLIAMLILVVISALPSEGFALSDVSFIIFSTVLKGLVLIGVLLFIGVKILPKLLKFVSRSQELLLLFSLAWCFLLAAFFQVIGFSMEVGALLAGVTLALSPFRFEISSKMRVLRDFFLVLFFIWLGSQLAFGNITGFIFPIIIFTFFILIGNPLIVMIIMGLLGYTKRNSFLAGLTVAQISEFSIILITLGIKVGHLASDILLLITAVGLATIAGSSYLILYSDKIYPFLAPYLSVFERKGKKVDEHSFVKNDSYDCILFGCNRLGYDVLRAFKKLNNTSLVVDYDPDTVLELAKKGVACKYGDTNDSELLDELPLSKAKIIVSTISNFETNELLIRKTRGVNKNCIIILIANHADDAVSLYNAGATYVVLPHFVGGKFTATMIEAYGLDLNKFLRERLNHLKYLEERRKINKEHYLYEIK